MFRACLLLGGNLGDRAQLLQKAVESLQTEVGNLVLASSIYETSAWGNQNQPNFLNQAVLFDTSLTALELLDKTQAIEISLGRTRDEHWGARTMDIDILFYNDEIIDTERLKIPHPLINMRKFVLLPLMEILPTLVHPIYKKSVESLYLNCNDQLEVKKYKTIYK